MKPYTIHRNNYGQYVVTDNKTGDILGVYDTAADANDALRRATGAIYGRKRR